MNAEFEIIVPCHFGMESVLKKEITELGYDITLVEDGRVTFHGDYDAVARANICLRTGERVLLQVGSFMAESFEELFEGIKGLPWEEYIPADGKFWVTKAASVRSKLFSPSDIQSIVKKAMVERLKKTYHKEWFSEDGAMYPVRIFIKNDQVTAALDTTGDSLHKRGYRKLKAKAPIAENLAAGLILLSGWRGDRPFADPFCGSGTFPIEAAMIAGRIAPGINRSFTAQSWLNVMDKGLWEDNRLEAKERIDTGRIPDICGSDMDGDMIDISIENARKAGVGKGIRFSRCQAANFKTGLEGGCMITNPPYGERLMDKEELPKLYGDFGRMLGSLTDWRVHVITAYDRVEAAMGMKAYKNRKLYNGMMKTYFYSFEPGRQQKSAGPAPTFKEKRKPKRWTMQ